MGNGGRQSGSPSRQCDPIAHFGNTLSLADLPCAVMERQASLQMLDCLPSLRYNAVLILDCRFEILDEMSCPRQSEIQNPESQIERNLCRPAN